MLSHIVIDYGGNSVEWWGYIAVGYAFGAASGWSVKVALDYRSRKNVSSGTATARDHSVAQSGNIAGGHIAGGDVNTRDK